jgi:hypothetical protein
MLRRTTPNSSEAHRDRSVTYRGRSKRRHDEITAAGIREVVVFHSAADELRRHTADLRFATIADPDKRYYREFGVEAGARASPDPGPGVRSSVEPR